LSSRRTWEIEKLNEQGNVLGDVVILASNPLGNADSAAGAALDDNANTRWPRISQRTAVDVGYEI
jgi:hypothetical protein